MLNHSIASNSLNWWKKDAHRYDGISANSALKWEGSLKNEACSTGCVSDGEEGNLMSPLLNEGSLSSLLKIFGQHILFPGKATLAVFSTCFTLVSRRIPLGLPKMGCNVRSLWGMSGFRGRLCTSKQGSVRCILLLRMIRVFSHSSSCFIHKHHILKVHGAFINNQPLFVFWNVYKLLHFSSIVSSNKRFINYKKSSY